MDTHHVSPCTTLSKSISERQEDQPMFQIENLTVIKPPLLKVFFWESLDIDTLNKELASPSKYTEHHLELPTRQLNSKPLKIVFWLRNLSNFEYIMRLKRIQNCQCTPKETRVGFNQFRNLYHCPHRRLIHIVQEVFTMRPNELLAMSVVAYYFILGTYVLSFELRISDTRVIVLHFHVNITTFDAVKSVLTTKLLAVNVKEHRCMSQPIWIRNITMQNLEIRFSGKNRGFRLINPNMVIPSQSVWPLIVEYKPSDWDNNLDLYLNYNDQFTSKGNRNKIPITCKGYTKEKKEDIKDYTAPVLDYECSDFPYVIYPNRLKMTTELNEERTLLVAVHNYDHKCIEFKWQTYIINEYFSFTFEPTQFTLKPHRSKLCVVQMKAFGKPLHFKRIPAVLEVHRIFDKSTQIAKELLTEIESIDDPKWAEDSYMEHVLLHIDFEVKFPELKRININEKSVKTEKEESNSAPNNHITIFEKLFWEYLSKSNYMRNTSNIPTNLTYTEVLSQETNVKRKESRCSFNKNKAFNIISSLMAEACRDISKNFRFIPQEMLDTI